MDRRTFVTGGAALGVLGLAGCTPGPSPFGFPGEDGPADGGTPPTSRRSPTASPASPAGPTSGAAPTVSPVPTGSPIPTLVPYGPYAGPTAPLPAPGTVITRLPFDGDYLAWTVDDGADPAVIRAYAELAAATGIRLTFFANGIYPGWKAAADVLLPLVRSGQVVIGNHTYSHTALTKLSDAGIIAELTRNDRYLSELFGVSPKPFYRPPYGYRNARTDRVAASIGYTVPVMWFGSLSDSGRISPDQVVSFAEQYFLPRHIVIGHANFPGVVSAFPRLRDILVQRRLQPVTLRDVYRV